MFINAGGIFGSINHDTYDPHENVAYSVAFRTLLLISKVVNDEKIRQFAYEKCLRGLDQFKMSEDRNRVATKGLLYMEKTWDTSYLWENAEAALAYFEAASDCRNRKDDKSAAFEQDGLTILRAISKHHYGPFGFLTEGVDWNDHVGRQHHIAEAKYGAIQYTEPFLNNQHIAEPTWFYLSSLAKTNRTNSEIQWIDREGNVLSCQPVIIDSANNPIFRDPSQPLDKRVSDLLSRLTLEEKAMILDHKGPTLERFNIRSDQWNQCLNGVKWDRPTTLFPTCIAMAATWNTNLVYTIATVLSDEARAIYNGWHVDPNVKSEHKGLIYRAPVINIGRNPNWGRNHEAWGEDPYLTGRMAVSYVRGLQGDDPRYLKVASTLKHYAVNNVEGNRTSLSAIVPEATLREYWLPHFFDAVVEGKAQSLMASYNAINGTPNNINHWLLTDLLKKEWKHEGFVVSDLGGVRTMVSGHGKGQMSYVDAVAQSVMAGCDFSDKEYRENIPMAVRQGKQRGFTTRCLLGRALAGIFRRSQHHQRPQQPVWLHS